MCLTAWWELHVRPWIQRVKEFCLVFWFVCLVWCLTSKSTAMLMVGSSIHLTTLFFLGKLDLAVTCYQYFVHKLLLVTDNSPSWISGREENGLRNYFMTNLRESFGPSRDGTCNLWTCSQAHYRLRYAARSSYLGFIPVCTDLWYLLTILRHLMHIIYMLYALWTFQIHLSHSRDSNIVKIVFFRIINEFLC